MKQKKHSWKAESFGKGLKKSPLAAIDKAMEKVRSQVPAQPVSDKPPHELFDLPGIAGRYPCDISQAAILRIAEAASDHSGYWNFREWMEAASSSEAFAERELCYKLIWPDLTEIQPDSASGMGNIYHASLWQAANMHDVTPRLQFTDFAQRLRFAAEALTHHAPEETMLAH
jgi:hypothetical protein